MSDPIKGKKRFVLNAAIVLVLAVIFGLQHIPVMVAVVVGLLALEWISTRLIDWWYGGGTIDDD